MNTIDNEKFLFHICNAILSTGSQEWIYHTVEKILKGWLTDPRILDCAMSQNNIPLFLKRETSKNNLYAGYNNDRVSSALSCGRIWFFNYFKGINHFNYFGYPGIIDTTSLDRHFLQIYLDAYAPFVEHGYPYFLHDLLNSLSLGVFISRDQVLFILERIPDGVIESEFHTIPLWKRYSPCLKYILDRILQAPDGRFSQREEKVNTLKSALNIPL